MGVEPISFGAVIEDLDQKCQHKLVSPTSGKVLGSDSMQPDLHHSVAYPS